MEYNGKIHETGSKTKEIIKELKELKAAVIFETVDLKKDPIEGLAHEGGEVLTYSDFVLKYW